MGNWRTIDCVSEWRFITIHILTLTIAARSGKLIDIMQHRQCLQCKSTIEPNRKRNYPKFCSRKCVNAFYTLDPKQCELCNNLFQPQTTKSRFCSRVCARSFQKTQRKVRTCPMCLEIFTVKPNKPSTKYCSFACGKKGGGEARRKSVEVICPICQVTFHTTPKNPRICCSKSCSAVRIRQESLKAEEGGRHTHSRRYKLYCQENDIWPMCFRCGFCEVPEVLHVHHKDCNWRNGKLENLTFVCPTCHAILHREIRLRDSANRTPKADKTVNYCTDMTGALSYRGSRPASRSQSSYPQTPSRRLSNTRVE